MRWRGCELTILERGIRINGLSDNIRAFAENLALTLAESCPATHVKSSDLYPIDAETWSGAESLSFETFAPASQQSHAGAGAGMLVNDW